MRPSRRVNRAVVASWLKPTTSLEQVSDCSPTVFSRVPCSAARNAMTPAPPGGALNLLISRPSARRTSKRVAATPAATTARDRPSSSNAAIAFGASASAKPSSLGLAARSWIRTCHPARWSATPAARPPIPAPTMSASGIYAPSSRPPDPPRHASLVLEPLAAMRVVEPWLFEEQHPHVEEDRHHSGVIRQGSRSKSSRPPGKYQEDGEVHRVA